MGWFLNLVKPRIQSNSESNIPSNLWTQCPSCSEMIFGKEWETALCVCPKCNYHSRIGAKVRLDLLADSYKMIDLPVLKDDPINFKDSQFYKDRIRDARAKTGMNDAILAAEVVMDGHKAVVFIMDFGFIGGSMGAAVGAAFLKCVEYAVAKNIPLIAITASGGARMQEGMISLMQMPKTVYAREILRQREIPYLVVLTDPTTGGVMASFASLGDITLAEPNALIGFTGPRVIEETMQIKLEPGFQKSEFHLKHGFIDAIVQRSELKETLVNILDLLTINKKHKNN